MKLGLYLTAELEAGPATTIIRVYDDGLNIAAARHALATQAQVEERALAQDRIIGQLQSQETARLRACLELLLPSLRSEREQQDSPAIPDVMLHSSRVV